MEPDVEYKILKELEKRLNGKCSSRYSCCPHWFDLPKWDCSDCVELFRPIIDIIDVMTISRIMSAPCPCKWVPDIALARLNERIQELEEYLLGVINNG